VIDFCRNFDKICILLQIYLCVHKQMATCLSIICKEDLLSKWGPVLPIAFECFVALPPSVMAFLYQSELPSLDGGSCCAERSVHREVGGILKWERI